MAETSTELKKDESSGFLSSIFTAAHNAVHNAHVTLSEDEQPQKTGLGPKLDSLLTGSRRNSIIGESSENTPFTPTSNSKDTPDNDLGLYPELSASNVHFEPVHDSLINTLGSGDLNLLHFDRRKKRKPETETHGPIEGLKEESNNKLAVLGAENKVVRRKSISNSVTEKQDLDQIDIDSDVHSVSSEESNARLDHILDSSSVTFATSKKDKDFHHTFRKIPASERLISDYSCALSKDILVQGKMYLSLRYICFNSNILGWVTNLMIPLQEVIQIEKKQTAVLFPNGIIIRTLHQKYVFATFLLRDATFNLITKIWHDVLLEGQGNDTTKPKPTRGRSRISRNTGGSLNLTDSESDMSEGEILDDVIATTVSPSTAQDSNKGPEPLSRRSSTRVARLKPDASNDGITEGDSDDDFLKSDSDSKTPSDKDASEKSKDGFANPGPATHAPTDFEHEKDANEVFIMDHTFKAPLGVIFSTLFGPNPSYYIKVLEQQKNIDIQKDKITEISESNKERHYIYVKPLGGPIGPKQTKCIITDKLTHCDFSQYVLVEQVTQTPDVPLGNAFHISTKIFLTWAANNSTKMHVVTTIEWSGKSWIKGAIEKGSIDGQKESMKLLVDTVTEVLSSGQSSGGTKKKRSKAKSISRRPTIQDPPKEVKPKELTLTEQITQLLETVGKAMPVQIPMVGDLISGILVLVILSGVYTWLLLFLIGGKKNSGGLELMGDGSFNRAVKLNNRGYYLLPTPDTYLNDGANRIAGEASVWGWINSRSQGKLPNYSSMRGADAVDEYANQEFAEIVRLAKQRVDQLNSQLNI